MSPPESTIRPKPWNRCECGNELEGDGGIFLNGSYEQCEQCDRVWLIEVTFSKTLVEQ